MDVVARTGKGVIVYGRSGVGKTRLLSILRNTTQDLVTVIDCERVSTRELDDLASWTIDTAPSASKRLLLLDNADVLLSKGSKLSSLKEILIAILDSSDGSSSNPSVFMVLACSLSPKHIDSDFIRSGRINNFLSLETKNGSERLSILEAILGEMNIPLSNYDFLEKFCDTAHGMVGADMKHIVDSLLVTKEKPEDWTLEDFEAEKKDSTVRMKPIKPPRAFDDFYGMDEIQKRVKTIILDPWKQTLSSKTQISIAPKGVLIYGPSGVGKTQFGMAIAQEIGFNQVIVNGSEIRSKIIGESEANIRRIFEEARQKSPCVLFIDQLDAVVPIRGAENTSENSGNRVVTSFLTEMDGILASTQAASHLIIIAVTNRKESIDPAILRPGRINEFLYIPAPAEKERSEIFRGILYGMPKWVSAPARKSTPGLVVTSPA
ncbi:AAA-domain-containing protein [Rhizoclosmatium globosum]|uniref:AAA-domain-containing protein n=1 Tax=Rhizoclosmatium globosum TaxID=329046 RepID=A0A1Y2BFC5_9FUNG|nr:AAA-domain-containing protein [Rhizoclosmatium globosum]|eukprot:ORY33529.1 AAA-domain-containing protein [Rhizoclosmatium globosum]